jgi:hypothetical protein
MIKYLPMSHRKMKTALEEIIEYAKFIAPKMPEESASKVNLIEQIAVHVLQEVEENERNATHVVY